jgi:release factor glutamine methyltransferase
VTAAGAPFPRDRGALVELLERAGFVAAEEDARELLARADGDTELLDELVRRRLDGEPIAWLTGSVRFCGIDVAVHPGVYVPRWHSEVLARRAAELLPDRGVAVDLCTGTGAIAKVLAATRPAASVLASDVDATAVTNARANGVDAWLGDLFDPLPHHLLGRVDVVVGVVPYVPTAALPLLQRDTFTFETSLAYDGGDDGTAVLRRAVRGSARFLRPDGFLLLELGGDQADLLAGELAGHGFGVVGAIVDDEGDVRGIEARRSPPR